MEIKSYKEGSKTYYSGRIWYYKNGNKKSKYKSGFEKKKDAENWCIDTERILKGLAEDADSTKVKDFLARWIKTKENKLSPTTLSGYQVNIDHINKYIGDTKLIKLKLIDVQEMLDKISATGAKYRTVKYIHSTLHAALNYAIKTELVKKNVSSGVEIREDDNENKFVASVYSADDLGKLITLLRELDHPLYFPVLLAAMRGLRRGECLGLRWSDIDFEKGIAYIRNNYTIASTGTFHRKVKTKESERLIDIDGFISDELKRLKELEKSEGRIQKYVCEINGKLPDPSHFARQLQNFQLSNNLPTCRFHDLRHTFAMLQLESGTDLDTLRRLLGHSKIGITSDIYLHGNKTLIKKASNNIDNLVLMSQKTEKIEMSQ